MSNLYIIPGHGDGDCGACGNGFQEAERVRVLAQRIKDLGGNSVKLCDPNLNARKSNVIGKGLVPKGYKILELHLDSSDNKSAKGGHVIISANFKADKYDKALAKMISGMFPGRSKTIVGRTDLTNLNRAASMGYNYRLMECCFISNANDIKKFNANIDKLAKEILVCFDIKAKETSTLKAEVEITPKVESVKTTVYYKKYTGKSASLVDALKSIGVTNTFANRTKIANKNGIKSYTGTAEQNTKLLNLLKQGKLIKP